jgi:Rrf2 family transcriptional regulator, cysteine metabolism repressor
MMILACHRDRGAIRVRDIAQEEGLPEKFLQSILLELKNGRMVESVRGAKGGHELCRDPNGIRLSEIIQLIDGPQAPFEDADLLHKASHRDRRHQALYQIFFDLRDASARILDNTTLADLISEPVREGTTGPAVRPKAEAARHSHKEALDKIATSR